MCDPATITTIATVSGYAAVAAGFGVGVATAVEEQEAAVARKKAANAALVADVADSQLQLRNETEEAAEANYQLAREAAINRGLAQNSGLGVTSVNALGRAVGFELGQDRATVQKNMKTANAEAWQRIDAANQQREAEYEAAGDTTGLRVGLKIGGAAIMAVVGAGAVGAAGNAGQAANAAAALAETGTATAAATAAAQAAVTATATTAQAFGSASALTTLAIQGANSLSDLDGQRSASQ